jgi:TnsA endonuclease C terminal/TnsA-like endonuclease N terminal
MARWRVAVTDAWIKSRIKQGYGAGEGPDYKPWLTVRDFPSLGRVHRVWGWKANRIHHLFSDLELKVFLHFLRSESVKDQREQFPLLPLEETIEIAKEIGIRHPTDPRTKHPIVMTTDIVLTVDQDLVKTYRPFTLKYMKDLGNLRTKEKLEMERRYWAAPNRNLKLKILTDQQVSNELVANMLWVLPFYDAVSLYPLTDLEISRTTSALTQLLLHDKAPLRAIAQKCDRLLSLEKGTGLAVVRHLIARRYWNVNIKSRIKTNEPLTLLNLPETALRDSRRLVA